MVSETEISAEMLRLLERAARSTTIYAMYERSVDNARALVDCGFLERVKESEYKITFAGKKHLNLPAVEPAIFAQGRKQTDPIFPLPGLHPIKRQEKRQSPESIFGHLETRQKELLRFVDHCDRNACPRPSPQEIADHLKVRSIDLIRHMISVLVDEGWLEVTDQTAGAVALARKLPGRKLKTGIQVSRYEVLTISIALSAPDDQLVEAAQEGIARLQDVIAKAQKGQLS
jgi:hypothetical protein